MLDLRSLIDASGNRFKEECPVDGVGDRNPPGRSPYQGITELGLDDTLLAWKDVSLIVHLQSQT